MLLQQLTLLQALDLGATPEVLEGPDGLHALLEAQKLAFADREAWYADPDHVDVPLEALLSPGYARERAALVDPGRASPRLRPGSPQGRRPVLPDLPDYTADGAPRPGVGPAAGAEDPVDGVPLAASGEPAVRPARRLPEGSAGPAARRAEDGPARGDTCHVDVVDRNGMMVAATPSGGWLQSSPVIPELGFPLGTRAQMFWLQPGLPGTLRPGARPRTTLSPSLALRDGLPWLAFGTPGGDQQDQWSLLLLLRLVHADRAAPLALQAAVDAPMLHSEHAPSSFHPRRAAPGRVVAEDRWPGPVLAGLRARGHDVVTVPGWSLGRLSVVARERRAGGEWLRAAANPRGATGYAVGR